MDFPTLPTPYDCRIMHYSQFRLLFFLDSDIFAFCSASRSQLPLILSIFSHFLNSISFQSTDLLSMCFTDRFYGDFQIQTPLVSSTLFSFCLSHSPARLHLTCSQLRYAPLPGWQILKSPFFSFSLPPSLLLTLYFPFIFIDAIAHDQGHFLHHLNVVSLLP